MRARRRRRRPRDVRFGNVALTMVAGVAMAAGVGTGFALDGPLVVPAVDAVAAPDPTLDTRALGSVAGQDASGRSTDRLELPADPAPSAPTALPAAPAPIDGEAVDAAGLTFADRHAGLLSTAVPRTGSGDLVVVAGGSPAPWPDRPVRTVRVEVEAGLDVDGSLFAEMVMATLNDPRGWGADGSMTFARTDGEAEIRVVLGSPDLVDRLCAPLDTVGKYSCGRNGHAALNHTRWVQATEEFADRTAYRQYLVNHEVGHLLGHGHLRCPGAGQRAPLMQQQSVTVAPCVPNGWPFPDG